MAGVFEAVTDVRGIMVRLGLAQPSSRAFVIGTAAAGVAYLARFPKQAFRDDGSMKPLSLLSSEPDATNTHFLLVPVIAAGAGYLFT
jgi:hypothetical protein